MGTPPNIGGTTTGTVAEDSGVVITGTLTDTSGNIFGDTWSIQSGGTYGTASIDPATGVWSYDLDDTNAIVDALDAGDTLTDTFTVLLSDLLGTDTQVITITITGVPCFMAGTRLETASGRCRVEDIRAGDLVHTEDYGLQRVRWARCRNVSHAQMVQEEGIRPIRITQGALGDRLPLQDLLVSRQHRILVTGPCVQELYGVQEALLPAVRLLGIEGVDVVLPDGDIAFHHLLFDRHQVVFAEGVASESLLFGTQCRQSLSWRSVAEIVALFPSAADQTLLASPARLIPDRKAQTQFVPHWSDRGGVFIKGFEGGQGDDLLAAQG